MNSDSTTNEQLIWKILDGDANPEEQDIFQQKLLKDEAFALAYNDALAVQNMLRLNMDEMQPSMRFSKNVMEQVAISPMYKSSASFINKNIIRGIAGLFFTMIAAVAYFLISNLHPATTSSSFKPEINLPVIDWSELISAPVVTVLMLMLTVSMLVFADQLMRTRKLQQHQ